ncbi:Hypothetical protein PHPALM_19127 [Phytophthora palmivora]|uniref:Uncharacterized protein n=1 Tax=Phytophthora palmivora TaxID=4796 RepID=A0A2P4XI24_9STRA|nr:Hypothetical protein PHPALM_19127 [Phytophthora palmivora]
MKPFKDRHRDIYRKYVIQNGIFTDAAQKGRHIAKSIYKRLLGTGPRDMEGVFATGMPPAEGVVGLTS